MDCPSIYGCFIDTDCVSSLCQLSGFRVDILDTFLDALVCFLVGLSKERISLCTILQIRLDCCFKTCHIDVVFGDYCRRVSPPT